MSETWALQLREGKSATALRLMPGVEACVVDGTLWLRGPIDDATNLLLRKTGGVRYDVGEGGALTITGHRVRSAALPAGPWSSAANMLGISLAAAALPGKLPERIALRLHRGGPIREANILRTRLDELARYVDAASERRLRGLRFAASSDGEVVLRGDALPPLVGARCVERVGIAIPCGFITGPPVGEAELAYLLGVSAGDLALLDEAGEARLIPADCFGTVSRASVRKTLAGDAA